ncbi:DUF4843 domain-containing protein [Carboxylicivirga linearis]|uniref:DUF4843 domain-containing protein n=1 Tax=Carboxylicivirga linearis TaxID=1628157 RepID=A0ABS5K1F8_9BACT|nr:DUF4843 domain-containing protein [Carboxylicivirga linearis]MBS2100376.1 DUF4843 domain-containing protein [Carboxylicivirga linearis]
MKKINVILVLTLAVLGLSCQQNEIEQYNGPSQIHFLEQSGSMIVNESNPLYTIEVGVSKAVDTDRTFEVVIDSEKSTAEEGVNFVVVNNQLVIPAGEVLGSIDVQGVYEGSEPNGVKLVLQLYSANSNELAGYNNSFELNLFKFCDFDRDAFIGTYRVYEHSYFGEFEYEVEITAGDDPYSVFVDGFWEVPGSKVQISFNRKETTCSIPSQYFFEDLNLGYENVWIRSLSNGNYNTCLGTIEELEYFVYPGDTPDNGWDRGTFDMYKITD